MKKQNIFVSLKNLAALYKSSKFLILLGSSNEDVDGSGDDDSTTNVFLLLNTRNICTCCDVVVAQINYPSFKHNT